MKTRALVEFAGVLVFVLVVAWGLSTTTVFDINKLKSFGFSYGKNMAEVDDGAKMCSLPKPCPPETFPFHIWSGAANVVGPKICFNGKIIMSHVLNNIGAGLNIVVADGKTGVVEKFGYLNMKSGLPGQVLKYLNEIKPDSIVLVATYDDASPNLTPEIKAAFEEMGSAMIKDLKRRDSWVFLGKTGAKADSFYEKISVNDPKNNVYDDWPRMVEVGGCYLKTQTEEENTAAPENEN